MRPFNARPIATLCLLCSWSAAAVASPLERSNASTSLAASLAGSSELSANAPGPATELLEITRPGQFTVDERLQKNKDFWVRIYSQYYTYQGLIHDAKYVDIIYETLDLRQGESARAGAQKSRFLRKAKDHWRKVLLSVHRKQHRPEELTADELHVFRLFQNVQEPNKFLAAAHRKRLRFQLGQKDRFLEGLSESGRYLPLMEEIFRKEGLPVDLTRLPFVESSFNVRARSKVGASGIWQFMRSTGRFFLTINDAVDERNDPIRATEAAAKLLKLNFESLRQWPLAVTAYNHGRKGMMRAVRLVGSDALEEVVEGYRGRSFGFASSNFFTELLAAIEVEKNAEKYFGKIERAPVLQFVEAPLPQSIALKDLVKFLKLDTREIRELNPGLTELVYSGARRIPAGYVLRLPYDGKLSREATVRVFLDGYDLIPGIYKRPGQVRGKSPRTRNL